MGSRFHDIDPADDGTCEWLLEHDTYKGWAARDRGLLWIKGKPGSGKSTLLKYGLANRGARDSDLILSFFFHGRGDELQTTPLGFFRSLLHQLLKETPGALGDLVDTFDKRRTQMGNPAEKWQWHPEELWRFFESSLPKILRTRQVWLFVDALDECGEANAVDLVEKCETLLRNLPSTDLQIHICFTCRHYPVAEAYCETKICVEDKNAEDISKYVQDRLSNFCAKTKSAIPDLITSRASGVFMWARLVVATVLRLDRKGSSLRRIEAAIHSIPPELDDLYQKLIQDMRSASLKLIEWICFATRPLTLGELRWAMVIEADCPYPSLRACQSAEDYISDNDRMERQVQTLSCGLAEVTSSPSPQVVQFIHQSVKDFFVEKGLSVLNKKDASTPNKSSEPMDVARNVHFRLSRICIHYFAMEEIATIPAREENAITSVQLLRQQYKMVSEFPFLHYTTTSWVVHTKQSDAIGVPRDDILELFAWPSNTLADVWARAYAWSSPSHYGWPRGRISLIHILSRYGALGPLTVILDQTSVDVEAADDAGWTALLLAAKQGQKTTVQLLLEKGANIEAAESTWGQTPLSFAAEYGHKTTVQMLLENGANIEAADSSGWTPLLFAAATGHEATVQLLLENGANIEAADSSGQTPLSFAAEYGHKTTVQLLLEKGANVKVADVFGKTPLSFAAEQGHDAVVQLLLEKGAKAEST